MYTSLADDLKLKFVRTKQQLWPNESNTVVTATLNQIVGMATELLFTIINVALSEIVEPCASHYLSPIVAEQKQIKSH